jgi:glycosyltransferase involved in cell wall biosynthesis
MKIIILGPVTYPLDYPLSYFLPDEDPICHRIFHPHPWITNLGQALAKIDDNEVHIMMMTGDVKHDRIFNYKNVHYHFIKSTHIILKALTFFKTNKWKMHKIFNELNPDIIHAQDRVRTGFFGLTSGFPCVITNHGQADEHFKALLNNKKNLYYYRTKWNENRVNRRMNFCIGVSPNCTQDCKRFIKNENVYLIDNAIDYVFFNQNRVEFNNDILYVGSVTNRKQTLQLIKAVKRIGDINLRIASFESPSKYYSQVISYIEENNLKNRVHFIGYKKPSELAKEMSQCLAVCLPSIYESFGMVLAEAMAVGKPVIASKVGGIPYVVKDGVTGYLFNAGNIDELSKKITILSNNKKIAQKMGEKAKLEAKRRWYPDVVAKKTMAVYKEILKEQY